MGDIVTDIEKIENFINNRNLEEASRLCDELRVIHGENPKFICTESILAFRQNKMDLAFQKINRSLQLDENNYVYHANLAKYLLENKRKEGLEEAVERTLQLNPCFNSYCLLLEAGFFQHRRDQIVEALNLMFEEIILNRIEMRLLFNSLIKYILIDWTYDEAVEIFNAILELASTVPSREIIVCCYESLAVINMMFARDIALARKYLIKCARYRGVKQYYHQLADVWGWLGNHQKLYFYSKKAYLQNPDNVLTVLLYSLSNYQQKRYAEAWRLVDKRLTCLEDYPCRESGDIYQAINDKSKKLIVSLEQGVGDEIMYAKLIFEIVKDRPDATFYCSERLYPIIARSFPRFNVKNSGKLFKSLKIDLSEISENYNFFYILSFAKIYFSEKESFVPFEKYILPNPKMLDEYKHSISRFNKQKKMVIGISWRSLSEYSRHYRNIPLLQWKGFIDYFSHSCFFVDLQMGANPAEVEDFIRKTGCDIYQSDVNLLSNIDNHMALIASCDLVISVDNSVVHFAGAMGIPTWILLAKFPDYRWLGQGDESNWYKRVSLVFQNTAGVWTDVFEKIRFKLSSLLAVSNSNEC